MGEPRAHPDAFRLVDHGQVHGAPQSVAATELGRVIWVVLGQQELALFAGEKGLLLVVAKGHGGVHPDGTGIYSERWRNGGLVTGNETWRS